ncbi:MAG: GGDEF domain-containing protein [Lachnospiraceae bacterium]|nr:GGDEF domain-containing protein [Lachnospiraceae bacterium]
MDFQAICDGFAAMTCVVSVEKLEGGRYGKIRLVTGNKAYIASVEQPVPGTTMLNNTFIPNSEYTDYITRDLNFEDYCYRSAVLKKCLHSYAHPDRMDVWFNMTFLPLECDDGNICYCTYTMEINAEADTENMSDISGGLASAVLQTGLKLRGATDFKPALKDVIEDIRSICDAEICCVLLIDKKAQTCEVLSEALSDDTKLVSMEDYLYDGFFAIADSWEQTVIAGSNCLIAKNEQDMEVVKERNPIWYDSITSAGGKNIVLFPLRFQGELLGYIWVINFNAEDTVKIKETLELTTFILGSEIGSYLLIDRLRILSSRDMLTGVMNRNEMNNLVDSMDTGEDEAPECVAVIFADLNGLKTVNDEVGHDAGDELIRNAAATLLEIFDISQIFRAGGDEFAVIVKGMTESEMNEKIEEIREGSKKYKGVSFSLGGCVMENSHDVRTALRLADERMYQDKKEYYDSHPDAKRRLSREEFVDV